MSEDVACCGTVGRSCVLFEFDFGGTTAVCALGKDWRPGTVARASVMKQLVPALQSSTQVFGDRDRRS